MIKIYKQIKILFLFLTFIMCSYYAYASLDKIVFNDVFPKSIKIKYIELNPKKVYLFSKDPDYKYCINDTLVIPHGKKNYPNDLFVLFNDGEWKVKLFEKIRKNNKVINEDIFYPWCCTQDDDTTFFEKKSIICEDTLLKKGIKFNYSYGRPSDRLAIKIIKINEKYFLDGNFPYLRVSYPVSDTKENIYSINNCISGSISDSKYIFSVPILNNSDFNSRTNIIISKNDFISGHIKRKLFGDNDYVLLNSLLFEVKKNYSSIDRMCLFFSFSLLFITGIYSVFRLYMLNNRYLHRNLIVLEQTNLLILRVVFINIILLGYPLMIIKVKDDPQRLYLYSLLVFIFSINLVWLIKKIITRYEKVKNQYWLLSRINVFIEKIRGYLIRLLSADVILVLIAFVVFLMSVKSSQEKLFGVPVIHVAKILYVLLPFVMLSDLVKRLEKTRFSIMLGVPIAYLLVLILSFAILIATKDFATPIFTFLALFLIVALQKENVSFVFDWIRERKVFFVIIIVSFVCIYYYNNHDIYTWFNSKVYRFASTLFLPNHEMFSAVDEQEKQTVAQQVYLIKTALSYGFVFPEFRINVLPAWRSTFFSDYAVLWGFIIGGYLFIFMYFMSLLYLSYAVISILVNINKKIPLVDGTFVVYGAKYVQVLNILLSLLLVQYVYTFLSNLWLLPVTGQSPGVLCPSYFEMLFHVILLNVLFWYYGKEKKHEKYDSDVDVYTKIKRNSAIIILVIFLVSMFFLFVRLKYIYEIKNELSLVIKKDEKVAALEYGDLVEKAQVAIGDKNPIMYMSLLNKYYDNDYIAIDEFKVSVRNVKNNVDLDSVNFLKKHYFYANKDTFYTVEKFVNYRKKAFINNKYFSGFPVESNTVIYGLQKYLNQSLEDWSKKIDSHEEEGYKMIGGVIYIVENRTGNILASASYPFLYNENYCHLSYVEKKMRKIDSVRIKNKENQQYLNMGEQDLMPGSIVKPLLAYCGMDVLERYGFIIGDKDLKYFIGHSDAEYATSLFELLSVNIERLKNTHEEQFAFKQFYDLEQNDIPFLDRGEIRSYAIGQQNKVMFRNVVQSYIRIMIGEKIKCSYYKEKNNSVKDKMSLKNDLMAELKSAMNTTLINGTAKDVGVAMQTNDINIDGYLAKTGTTQIGKNKNHNRTSSFILVSNKYTIGIQLYGDLPQNEFNDGVAARHLFIVLIPELKNRYHLFE